MSKLVIVTGANKGIGYETVKALARDTPFRIVLCARDVELGEAAKKKIAAAVPASKDRIFVEQLDISDEKSIKSFADRVGDKFGVIDVMIHNAGMYDGAEKTLTVNYYGTLNVQAAMEKYILKSNEPRVIFVSSETGKWTFDGSSDEVKKMYRNCKEPTDVDKLIDAYVLERNKGESFVQKLGYEGWGKDFYCVGKLGLTTRVKIMAGKQVGKGKGKYAMMVSLCPGHCATDITKNTGEKTAEQGAETPVWLASAPLAEFQGNVKGNFWVDKQIKNYL